MPAHFTPETMRFLRGLARHNDRAWFEERRPVYERAVKAPLQAVIGEVNEALAEVAPEFVRPPHKIAMRIFRDIRFSPDKRPYKTHVSAWWSCQGLEKTSAAGFFFQVGPAGGMIAAGIYAPERDDLLLVRRWLADHHERYQAALAPLLQTNRGAPAMSLLDSQSLTRMPKGFLPDHPAGELLRARNWGVTAPLTTDDALQPDLPQRIAATLRRALPLVGLLNEPFLQRAQTAKAPSWL